MSSPLRLSRRASRAWLNFDGINWKADVFFNGEKLGRIEGGFMRGRFDVTTRLLAGGSRMRWRCGSKRTQRRGAPSRKRSKTAR